MAGLIIKHNQVVNIDFIFGVVDTDATYIFASPLICWNPNSCGLWYQNLQTFNRTNSTNLTTATTMFSHNGHRFSGLTWSHHGSVRLDTVSTYLYAGICQNSYNVEVSAYMGRAYNKCRVCEGQRWELTSEWNLCGCHMPARPSLCIQIGSDPNKATRQPSMCGAMCAGLIVQPFLKTPQQSFDTNIFDQFNLNRKLSLDST